jgi:glutathionyl-hydroquinone reductase
VKNESAPTFRDTYAGYPVLESSDIPADAAYVVYFKEEVDNDVRVLVPALITPLGKISLVEREFAYIDRVWNSLFQALLEASRLHPHDHLNSIRIMAQARYSLLTSSSSICLPLRS